MNLNKWMNRLNKNIRHIEGGFVLVWLEHGGKQKQLKQLVPSSVPVLRAWVHGIRIKGEVWFLFCDLFQYRAALSQWTEVRQCGFHVNGCKCYKRMNIRWFFHPPARPQTLIRMMYKSRWMTLVHVYVCLFHRESAGLLQTRWVHLRRNQLVL